MKNEVWVDLHIHDPKDVQVTDSAGHAIAIRSMDNRSVVFIHPTAIDAVLEGIQRVAECYAREGEQE